MKIQITKKQKAFLEATADEVLFGGAAGGGKSYGQLLDAFLYALKYPESKQLILRRTYPELEKSLIRVSLGLYPKEVYQYNSASHVGRFVNGSVLDFAYCDSEKDVYKYQSAEYDVIRFDELTHFTENMYTYLISRLRGTNPYPKQMKSSTNPGGIGHAWVKERFIDMGEAGREHSFPGGNRIFIPSRVVDNHFLMEKDPGYLKRLENLPEREKRALKDGDWDITEGMYFSEFRREIHTMPPFAIPDHWRKYVALDYGLDMLAAYLIAVDTEERAYVMLETYKPGLIVSEACKAVHSMIKGHWIEEFYAPPDLWNRHKDTGKSTAEIFSDHGILLSKVSNDRVQGWLDLKEWLKPYEDEQGAVAAKLRIFTNCRHLIRTLPSLQISEKNPNDTASEPHELTHGPDALRYFVAGRPFPAENKREKDRDDEDEDDLTVFLNYQ